MIKISVNCGYITGIMEKLAPELMAEKWDNVGLQIGSPGKRVKRILVALDLVEQVALEAAHIRADMIITHHPFIFDAVKTLREDRPFGRIAALLIKNDIALYCAHTNLDSAPGGINDLLVRLLGLRDARVLEPCEGCCYDKVVVFVPAGHEDKVAMTMAEAGAGWIGSYSHCTFRAKGIGTFKPGDGTTPFVGEPGKLERVEEYRIESIVPSELTRQVVQALLDVHPYQEVAYDIYRLGNKRGDYGLGRIGLLPDAVTLKEFAKKVKRVLGIKQVRCTGAPDGMVQRVALCGGSGASLIEAAAAGGADVLLTGDIKYHDAHKSLGIGMALVDAGHYGTEKIAVDIIKDHIEKQAGEAAAGVEVIKSRIDIDPFTIV